MKIVWEVEPEEVAKLRRFVYTQKDNPFVRSRIERNVTNPPTSVEIDLFWQVLVSCLLTSRQRSGPDSYVSQFLRSKPFSLTYAFYQQESNPLAAGERVLRSAGGIRFYDRIAGYLAENYATLSSGMWVETREVIGGLIDQDSPSPEHQAARFMRENFKGVGPKQSRTLLQILGLTKYEFPLDSRITRWLNNFH